jgi:hypothetical protein
MAGSLTDRGFMQGGMDEGVPDVEFSMPMAEDFSGGAVVTETDDGGATVQGMAEVLAALEAEVQIPHDANLAEYLDDAYLGAIASDLTAFYEDDLLSREEWEEAYTNGLDLLGVKTIERTEPFQGASGVTHPLISESVTQFQAQAYKELLPAGGPVKTGVMGLRDPERESQASRVRDFMN